MSDINFRNKSGSISFQVEKRNIKAFIYLTIVVLITLFIGISVGSTWLNPITVITHLLGLSDEHTYIIHTLRLPRVLLSFLVGAALAVSGLILQSLVRNPLASPDIIGITGGASVGAVFFLITFAGTVSIKWLPVSAITGALLVAILVYSLSWKNGITPIRLVLIGIGVSAGMSSLTTMMIVLSEMAIATKAYVWLTGSVYGANWENVYGMLIWALVFIPLTFLFSRTVNAKQLGDDVATSLGIHVQLQRFALLFISVVLAGSAVSYAGGIGFVGLVAPHIARMIIGRSFGPLIFSSALIGGLLVLVSDIIARTAFLPLDLPAGVFTAGIGAPFFIYLLFRKRNM
ncbi:FecCD family ABC transporter permease [Bacillus suaedae]|uniref:Iron ABC transporter permease n=1 Tax=Halalkalibacter suaedae TaxID=2822140 RepID=A0A940WTX3_9BACI|nr:iron ABC transporter permease [Bacillus suaedae]